MSNINEEKSMTKKEKACIELGIPETGDKALDDLIRKAERKKIAAQAMQGLVEDGEYVNWNDIAYHAIGITDVLLNRLEATDGS